MRTILNFFVVFLYFTFANSSFAADQVDQEAMRQVLSDPQKQAEINALSADIFGDLAKESNGDLSAVDQKLQQAMKDPEAFMSKLTPAQLAKIKAMAAAIDSKAGGAQKAPPNSP